MADINSSKRVLIAYHADCIDGFTSAWIANKAMIEDGNSTTLLPMYYNIDSYNALVNKAGDRYIKLYIVDFSVPLDILERIGRLWHSGLDTIILDHHKTAFEMYAPDMVIEKESYFCAIQSGVRITLDNNECGASLCWKYFNPNEEMPKLISYVKDYDLWRFDLGDETKWINKFLNTREKSINIWDDIVFNFEYSKDLDIALSVGRQLQEAHNLKVNEIAGRSTKLEISCYVGLAVDCLKEFVSDVGHELANRSGTFGAMYHIDTAGNQIVWSLRSNGDFDVSAIAKKYGGGGHRNAAGFITELFPGTSL